MVVWRAMLLLLYYCLFFICDLVFRIFVCCIFFIVLAAGYKYFRRPLKKSLNGEIILVTGASRGIGRELALEFARRRGILVLWGRDEVKLKQTAIDIEKFNGKANYYICDVTNREAVKQVAAKVRKEVGHVTILVNNAGANYIKEIEKLSVERVNQIIDINLLASCWTISEFLPDMKEMNHGHIVALASGASYMPAAFSVPYCGAKFGLRGLMEALDEELRYQGHKNINVTTVFPSFVNTTIIKPPKVKHKWLVPTVEPDFAAKQIVDGIQSNAEQVFVPNLVYITKFISLLPRKVRHLITDLPKVELILDEDD